MLQLSVALPNGDTELLTLLPSATVQDVRTKAEQAFGKKHLRLITAKNRVLDDPDKNLTRSRDRGRRVPYSSGTSTATGGNRKGLCLVVSWRQRNRDLG